MTHEDYLLRELFFADVRRRYSGATITEDGNGLTVEWQPETQFNVRHPWDVPRIVELCGALGHPLNSRHRTCVCGLAMEPCEATAAPEVSEDE